MVFGKHRKQTSIKGEGIPESKGFARVFAARAKKGIEGGMRKMGNEAVETGEMAKSFFSLLEHKLKLGDRTDPPSKKEVREAIEQLKDVGRLSVFTTAVILPGGAVSLLGLEILARKFGIHFTFIPSSFRKNAEWKHPDGRISGRQKSRINSRDFDIKDVQPEEE